MWWTILSAAFADPYLAELAIPASYPANASGGLVGFARALMVADEPDSVVSSSDPRIRCVVDNGLLMVKFQADQADWPATLPLNATCSRGADTLTVRVVPMNPAVDGSPNAPNLINGNTIVVTKVVGSHFLRAYALPPGNYQPGVYASPNMTATRCVVHNVGGGAHIVQLRSGAQAGASSGTCSLPRPGAAPLVLTLQVYEGTI